MTVGVEIFGKIVSRPGLHPHLQDFVVKTKRVGYFTEAGQEGNYTLMLPTQAFYNVEELVNI